MIDTWSGTLQSRKAHEVDDLALFNNATTFYLCSDVRPSKECIKELLQLVGAEVTTDKKAATIRLTGSEAAAGDSSEHELVQQKVS